MKKKILSIALIAALVAIAAMGTIAYFTDDEEVTNVMTFGKVDIELTEPAWDPEEDHVLVPGVAYPKDPTLTLTCDSLQSWVMMDVKVDSRLVALMAANEDMTVEELMAEMVAHHTFREEIVNKWMADVDHEAWEVIGVKTTEDQLIVRLGYKTVFQPCDEVVFMTALTVPATVNSEMVESLHLEEADIPEVTLGFQAYAVQAMPVDTLEEAAAVIPAL